MAFWNKKTDEMVKDIAEKMKEVDDELNKLKWDNSRQACLNFGGFSGHLGLFWWPSRHHDLFSCNTKIKIQRRHYDSIYLDIEDARALATMVADYDRQVAAKEKASKAKKKKGKK
jgi:hypothetical protein